MPWAFTALFYQLVIQKSDNWERAKGRIKPKATGAHNIFIRSLQRLKMSVNLQDTLDECKTRFKKFFTNDVMGAIVTLRAWSHTSQYHRTHVDEFDFHYPPIIPLDKDDIEDVLLALRSSRKLYNDETNYDAMAAQHLFGAQELVGLLQATNIIYTNYNKYMKCTEVLEKLICYNYSKYSVFLIKTFFYLGKFSALGTIMPICLYKILEAMPYWRHKIYRESGWIILSEPRLRILRDHCAFAAAMYRHASHLPDHLHHVQQICSWEIMWSNASAPLFSKKIAGRSLAYHRRGTEEVAYFEIFSTRLMVSSVELLSLWNVVSALSGDPRANNILIRLIENICLRLHHQMPYASPSCLDVDYRILLSYIYGCCLAAVGKHRLALAPLYQVTKFKRMLRVDNFLVPYSLAEAAMCYNALGNKPRALRILRFAGKKYNNFTVEFDMMYQAYMKVLYDDPGHPVQ
ncbi:unnamed protein product, partial [Iphiclides podalirius]